MQSSYFYFVICLLAFSCNSISGSKPKTGRELILKSIEYHDPTNNWSHLKATLVIQDSLPPGRDSRFYEVFLDNSNSKMGYKINGLSYEVIQDSLIQIVGEIEEERALRMRNYYTYLWGLPMKLMDAGTVIEDSIRHEILGGKEYLVARVPYDKDTWYFYINPENFRMEAYKFFQDEANLVGEIIYLQKEIEFNSLRIPAQRTWYRTEKPEFLGTDILLEVRGN
ncbi:DUF6503 family protein [Algoriphagus sp. CAU 1675]|uniref:DUF6503 family protein n=1 Tax=Algoriphagus sp. CAU 1675 TaxID=3032597 RepID=UPI0023DB069D|nr:DUF6503 family protein [Algoriphagus sp. CAU 1675]MDF2157842.1 DUF6503 family protein [Algoriphagus sp. CAU 1675]